MSASELAEITAIGEKLGYKGTQLADFLRDERTLRRDREKEKVEAQERAREHEKEKMEAEKEKMEAQERAREKELEIEKQKMEAQERLETQKMELEKERLQVQRLELESRSSNGGTLKSGLGESRGIKCKLPPFDDSKEQIDAYLFRFEKFAEANKWDKALWAINLSSLLKGEALSVYHRLSMEESDDYGELKEALLKRYQLTEDGFRKKFRKERPQKGESFRQFATRISMYLDRWVELSKIRQTYGEVRDLLIREQILNVASRELKMFLRERQPADVTEMAKLAEQYLEVHGKLYEHWAQMGEMDRNRSKSRHSGNSKHAREGSDNINNSSSQNAERRNGRSSQGGKEDRRQRTCFLCHRPGHLANACRSRPKPENSEQVTSLHFVFDEDKYGNTFVTRDGIKVPATVQYNRELVEMKSALCVSKPSGLPYLKGRWNEREVSVLRDTGSDGVIVRRDLCRQDEFTGKVGRCTFVDGSQVRAPMVRVSLDTPYFVGKVQALAMASPFFDVIVGNVAGARRADKPDASWERDYAGRGEGSTERQGDQGDGCSRVTSSGSMPETRKASRVQFLSPGSCQVPTVRSGEHSSLDVSCAMVNDPDEDQESVGSDIGVAGLFEQQVSKDSGPSVATVVPEGATSGVTSKGSQCSDQVGSGCSTVGTSGQVSRMASDQRVGSEEVIAASVVTRSQARVRKARPLKVADPELLQVNRSRLMDLQREDATLDSVRALVGKSVSCHKTWQQRVFFQDGVLVREHTSSPRSGKKVTRQVVLPKCLRVGVMQVAHDSILGGHLGAQKTVNRVMACFYWPGVLDDIKRYCASCDVCQRTTPKGRVGKVPLGSTPLIEIPFSRVAVDIVGPLPASSRGFRYIFTLVDYATRYPEAIPLRRIETEDVAEAMMAIFSRVGFPREILSDRGSQFTSDMMSEVSRLISVKQLHTTPYHAMANGLVERFNGTLKSMLKRMCDERPRDWDRYVDALLFAYREVPQEGTGFSPFELLYGRTVRGPMSILKELWSGESLQPIVRSTYEYVFELRNRLQDTCELAQASLARSKVKQKRLYDRKAKQRSFQPGDSVLLLLPTANNKLIMQWKDPFLVIDKVGESDYQIEINGKVKLFHANMLKRYVSRDSEGLEVTCNNVVVCTPDTYGLQEHLFCPLEAKETVSDVEVSSDLEKEQARQVRQLVSKFREICTDLPGRTDLIECHIDTLDATPIRQKPYPVPLAMKEAMRQEVEKMQRMGVIEDSRSEFCNPSVMVRKSDGSHRYCIDFRKVNNVSVFDAEPIPRQDEILARLGRARYFSKIDLSKGFWQIPIAPEDRHKTAFATDLGLKQFVVMPFGLINASSVFCRMMRQLLEGLSGVESYIDDVVVYSSTWKEHMATLEQVFTRLKKHGLTVRPSKCSLGFSEIDFLGHRVGRGQISPQADKVQRIFSVSRPESKKELRSYLGLISYHRRFIKDFAAKASELTDMLSKGKPVKIRWSQSAIAAFEYFKSKLAEYPILRLFDSGKEIYLAVDSSDRGIGAVLQQVHEGQLCPVLYLSRKLSQAERRYSAIERECLALVWAIRTLHPYVYGREFVVMSDHQPLAFLNSAKYNNSRVMRWALDLQIYRFRVQVVRGCDNHAADYLSRKGAGDTVSLSERDAQVLGS